MGRVFSEEQIKNGEIPTPADFEQAVRHFRSSVEEGIASGSLDGAVVFGSVAIGAATIRSDLDAMIVPIDHSPEALQALKRVHGDVDDYARYVPVNTSLHHRNRLASGNHEIDRFFGSHLTGPQRIVIGSDPAEYMQFNTLPARDILLAYVCHKMRGISRLTVTFNNEEYFKGLQRLLELPLAIGRKALMVIDEIEGTSVATTDSANKHVVTERVLTLFEEMGVEGTAKKILDYDSYYNDELEEVIRTRHLDGYTHFLEELDELALEASPWLDELHEAIDGRVSDRSLVKS